ncbi:MAG: hypothetical protein LBL66_02575, partial [Clostridiales bacterium]|nr:hypothetical protein [Clostridiales bacterium]
CFLKKNKNIFFGLFVCLCQEWGGVTFLLSIAFSTNSAAVPGRGIPKHVKIHEKTSDFTPFGPIDKAG